MRGTSRQREFRRRLRELAPLMPLADFEPVVEAANAPHLRALPGAVALWQALVAHVRHAHTDYDALLAEGYDRDSARHFTTGPIEDVLSGWGCTRRLPDED